MQAENCSPQAFHAKPGKLVFFNFWFPKQQNTVQIPAVLLSDKNPFQVRQRWKKESREGEAISKGTKLKAESKLNPLLEQNKSWVYN